MEIVQRRHKNAPLHNDSGPTLEDSTVEETSAIHLQ